MTPERREHEQRIIAVANRVNQVLVGTPVGDGIVALMQCMAFGWTHLSREELENLKPVIKDFFDELDQHKPPEALQ